MERRCDISQVREETLDMIDDVGDSTTVRPMELALDKARAQQFRLPRESLQTKWLSG
jgi:hypothetical protein